MDYHAEHFLPLSELGKGQALGGHKPADPDEDSHPEQPLEDLHLCVVAGGHQKTDHLLLLGGEGGMNHSEGPQVNRSLQDHTFSVRALVETHFTVAASVTRATYSSERQVRAKEMDRNIVDEEGTR